MPKERRRSVVLLSWLRLVRPAVFDQNSTFVELVMSRGIWSSVSSYWVCRIRARLAWSLVIEVLNLFLWDDVKGVDFSDDVSKVGDARETRAQAFESGVDVVSLGEIIISRSNKFIEFNPHLVHSFKEWRIAAEMDIKSAAVRSDRNTSCTVSLSVSCVSF